MKIKSKVENNGPPTLPDEFNSKWLFSFLQVTEDGEEDLFVVYIYYFYTVGKRVLLKSSHGVEIDYFFVSRFVGLSVTLIYGVYG